MSETTRVRRTPAEIVAAKEADLANSKARAAVDAQMGNPAVKTVSGFMEANSTARINARKVYNGNPNQTAENRRKSHTLWIEEINAEQAEADAQIALSDYVGPLYRTLRNDVAQALAEGITQAEADTMVGNGMDAINLESAALLAELVTCQGNTAIATEARKAFISSKKAGKANEPIQATA